MSFRRPKDEFASSSEKIEGGSGKAWKFARRMIVDGIMPLETISRLTGLDIASVQEQAASIARNSGRDT